MQLTKAKTTMFIRDIPVKLGIQLIGLIGVLPYPTQVFIGKGLGILMLFLARNRRRIATQNFQLCFPNLDSRERKKLLIENFKSTGIGLMEAAFSWTANSTRIKAISEVKGIEHLRAFQDSGKGAIVLGFHLTSLELGGNALALHIPIAAMYRQHRNPHFEKAMCEGRLNNVTDVIERDDVRNMLRSLKSGKSVWYAADQDYGATHSLFAPFFNIPTATITATSRFVKMTDVPVIPMTHYRHPQTGKLIIQLHPALEGFTSKDDYTDACVINNFLEEFLQQHPADYLWLHRRFKTRPPGMPNLYDPKSLYKIQTLRELQYEKTMKESKLLNGSKERPKLIQLPNGEYFKFIYRKSFFQRSPARQYTREWQKDKDSEKQIVKLFRYIPLNAEVVRYIKIKS
ncbi:MAG: LpxL/LpxP family Kdo(2)-lipid IV(A) lauroyl/palmitoleoyl acyltransferase [Gammaproteobacteria bacterium]|nr:LpxL/LpxP family Kdo(2)-lipid IV(A) lauroyl/palmitoleoyl acyltransferase [Gammaproteobacteria bacterium]